MAEQVERILLTPGEPAGIGPDTVCQLAQHQHRCELIAVADPAVIAERASLLGLALEVQEVGLDQVPLASKAGVLKVLPVRAADKVQPGVAEAAHAPYVLQCLDRAVDACVAGQAAAMLTGPVNKASIIEAGYRFSGHTEYLAERTGTKRVVMMLACDTLRVALLSTHLPLAEVAGQVTAENLREVILITHKALRWQFGCSPARIAVCGLNPHAGEQGHLGREEVDIMQPALDELRRQGLELLGPLPADTVFTPRYLNQVDAVLAMYHDQGLPVIKHAAFGKTVNVTLGLPIIRTSVDHGTALDIAGSGQADAGSLAYALGFTETMLRNRAAAR